MLFTSPFSSFRMILSVSGELRICQYDFIFNDETNRAGSMAWERESCLFPGIPCLLHEPGLLPRFSLLFQQGSPRGHKTLLNWNWNGKSVTNGAKCFTIFKAASSRKYPGHPKLI
jgi:hypothetical protein